MYVCSMRMTEVNRVNNMTGMDRRDRMDSMNRMNRMNRKESSSAMSGEISNEGYIIIAALLVFGFAFLPLLLRQMA